MPRCQTAGYFLRHIPHLQEAAWLKRCENPEAFLQYVVKEGLAVYTIGEEPRPRSTAYVRKAKSDQILAMVLKGLKYNAIIRTPGFAGCGKLIRKLLSQRHQTKHRAECMYVWGPSGTGKTDSIRYAIDAWKDANPELVVDYHNKMGGWEKWHDGYDCHEVQIIDDCAPFRHTIQHQEWLQLLGNRGPHTVQMKGSTINYEARLVFATSNNSPSEMVANLMDSHKPAMLRRIQKNEYHMSEANERPMLQLKVMELMCKFFKGINPYREMGKDLYMQQDFSLDNLAPLPKPMQTTLHASLPRIIGCRRGNHTKDTRPITRDRERNSSQI